MERCVCLACRRTVAEPRLPEGPPIGPARGATRDPEHSRWDPKTPETNQYVKGWKPEVAPFLFLSSLTRPRSGGTPGSAAQGAPAAPRARTRAAPDPAQAAHTPRPALTSDAARGAASGADAAADGRRPRGRPEAPGGMAGFQRGFREDPSRRRGDRAGCQRPNTPRGAQAGQDGGERRPEVRPPRRRRRAR